MSKLADIIALGEGFSTEFKRSGTGHLGRELCAFANTTGGVVLIGADDDGTDPFQTLEPLHLIKEGKMTNAGAWLLGH